MGGTPLEEGREGTHATISSNRFQDELVIGRVGVLGNLGKEKSINSGVDTRRGSVVGSMIIKG